MAADACLMGFMTTNISKLLSTKLNWARLDTYPIEIYWDKLPRETEPGVPQFPWLLSYTANYMKSHLHWWEGLNETRLTPHWWSDPSKEVECVRPTH